VDVFDLEFTLLLWQVSVVFSHLVTLIRPFDPKISEKKCIIQFQIFTAATANLMQSINTNEKPVENYMSISEKYF
jgi:hypothetical protein